MLNSSISGVQLLKKTLGRRVRRVRRWIPDLGGANNELGDGITEIAFDDVFLVFRPGPNEDFIIVDEGEFQPGRLDPIRWTGLDLSESRIWSHPKGCVVSVESIFDGFSDIGIRFRLDGGGGFILVYVDTDLILIPTTTLPEGLLDAQFREI